MSLKEACPTQVSAQEKGYLANAMGILKGKSRKRKKGCHLCSAGRCIAQIKVGKWASVRNPEDHPGPKSHNTCHNRGHLRPVCNSANYWRLFTPLSQILPSLCPKPCWRAWGALGEGLGGGRKAEKRKRRAPCLHPHFPCMGSKTEPKWDGLRPWTFTAVFALGHTSPPTTKYKETVHEQLEQILDPKDTKRPKNPTATFEVPRANTRYCACPLHTQHHLRGGQTIEVTPPAWPRTHPTLTPPHKEKLAPPQGARKTSVCSLLLWCSRDPNKASPESPGL